MFEHLNQEQQDLRSPSDGEEAARVAALRTEGDLGEEASQKTESSRNLMKAHEKERWALKEAQLR